jgi:hypothetical protein
MRKAIFQFALSGKKSVLSTHVAELVEYGVASLDSGPDCDSLTNTHFLAKIDEPIIIQAGINFFGLRTTVTDNFVASSGPSMQAIFLNGLHFPVSKRISQVW